MLRVNQLNGFGVPFQIPTLRQAEFLLLPSQSRVAIDGTGGFPDVGGNVGAIVNQGTRGGSLFATNNANRGTLRAPSRISVQGTSSVQLAQTFTAATTPTIYTITAFIPRTVIGFFERVLSCAETSGTDDFAATSLGGALLLRNSNTTSWGVFRRNALRGSISATINVLTIFETICETSQVTICKDGGTDTVTAHASFPDFNVASLRLLCSHEVSGVFGSPSGSDVLVSAVFFTNPTADFRARALAEVRAIAGIPTP
jgi:hypothetical protein